MQVGAFYPFSRNHNTIGAPDQDPTAFGKEVADISRAALLTRYSLLPLLYTLFYLAHAQGAPVFRALVFEFPADPATHPLDRQFMWGGALLFTPVLQPSTLSVQVPYRRPPPSPSPLLTSVALPTSSPSQPTFTPGILPRRKLVRPAHRCTATPGGRGAVAGAARAP